MTDATPIIPRQRVRGFLILSVARLGKQVVVGCACGATHIFSTESLLNGTAACSALPITSERAARMRAEAEEQERRREQQKWKPGDRQ
jgi:hypothetical protein